MYVKKSVYDAIKRKVARAARREDNRRFIRKVRKVQGLSLRVMVSRKELKDEIVHLLGLLDRKKFGPYCRLGPQCPEQAKIGIHPGEVGYHLVPQSRGDAARFIPENVVWACHRANYGEYKNRSLYREKHILAFGKERVERIESIARTIRHYTTQELVDLRNHIRRDLED